MSTPRKLGILGGMGPEATALLMQRIIRATPARDDSDHVPLLIDNNPQVPSRIDALIHGTGPSPLPTLIRMAKGLEAAGAEALIMPCNTAHHYVGQIREQVGIPFLDMIALTCERVSSQVQPQNCIGILASPAVGKTRLFDTGLQAYDLGAIYPENPEHTLDIIKTVKATGPSRSTETSLNALADELIQKGAKAIIVACTEFSLLTHGLTACPVPVLDSLDVLVDASVGFALTSG